MKRTIYGGGGGAVDGPVDGTWTSMTLANGWTAGTIAPQYMKDSRGRVHLRGRVVSPVGLTGTSVVWTAPVGFTPPGYALYFEWVDGAAAAGTDVAPKTVAILASGGSLVVNYNSSGGADLLSGKVSDLGRMSWATT